MIGRSVLALAVLGGCSSAPPGSPAEAQFHHRAKVGPPPTEFECRWAEGPIAIDGSADEADWKKAEVIDCFRAPWTGGTARTATRGRLLWDRENLYFFADLDDGDLFADLTEHDSRTWNNDVFELFFKPAADKSAYYEFQVNAANTGLDMLLRPGGGGYDKLKADGDFSMAHAVKLRGTLNVRTDRDRGWSVEGKIPWRDFLRTGGRPNPGERWTMNLSRYDYDVSWEKPDLSTCAPLTQPSFHRVQDFAGLTFVAAPPATARPPLATSRVVGSPDPPLPYRAVRVYPDLKLSCVIGVAAEPGADRLLFIEQQTTWGPSALKRMKDDPAVSTAETLLSQDGTAYGMAFRDGHLYLGWNGPHSKKPKMTRVSRFALAPAFDAKSEKTILSWESDGHNGGDLAFGPDGMLYVTSGDGTSDSDTNVTGQDLTKLLAKVLRIDVGADPYRVPPDNPFLGTPGARPETWAYGFRNPWRIHIDRRGRVFVGNNGQDLWEQVYLVERGANYGWSVMEGSHPFYPDRTPGPTPFSKPAAEHPHSEARSLTGGLVYEGSKLPGLRGAYLYGDHSTGKIWAWRDGRSTEIADTTLSISGFGTDTRGELLICDHRPDAKGGFYTLEPTPAGPRPEFPRTLSASGLFRSVKGHVIEPSLVPYDVNSPLWSDGARKARWIAVPAGGRIDFTTNRGWNFPDGSVLVKSFALGDRWIETRFLTRQEGEWVGYSYEWNDEQTEGTLVDAAGKDRRFGAQSWRYPSRAECMACHSRAANFVLGLTELQMNRGGQLETLERLGLLKVDWAAAAREELKEVAKAKGMKQDDYVGRHSPLKDQRPAPPSTLLAKRPESYRRLADPYDPKADLESRARSYLHANCAHCHVEAGGGNAQMELEATTARDKMRLIDAKPVHHTDGIEDARLVAPGSPERSMLLRRTARRGPGQMPPLASSLPDDAAVRLLEAWIRGM